MTSLRQDFQDLVLKPHSQVRIKVNDGRVIEGIFSCMDSDMNFILDHAIEYYGDYAIETDFVGNVDIVRRNLGMAMIAGHHIVRVCVRDVESMV